MTRADLKKYLQDHALNKSGKINSRYRAPTNIVQAILDATANFKHDYTLSLRMQLILRDIEHEPICPVCCSGHQRFSKAFTWSKTCSRECSNRDPRRIEKIQSKINYSQAVSKRQDTTMARYGVAHTTQLESVKQRVKQTILEKYGVDNVSKSSAVKARKIATRAKTFKDPEIKQKHYAQVGQNISQSLSPNCNMIRENIAQLLKDATPTQIANQYQVGVSTVYRIINEDRVLSKQYIRNQSSSYEQLVGTWLDEIGVEYQTHNRSVIAPRELDIYVPGKNLAIEINGWYWHNESKKSPNYHLEKTANCATTGIRLMHLWDYELDQNPALYKSMVLAALGLCSRKIHARCCQIVGLSTDLYQRFLLENHHQGAVTSEVRYGLRYQDQLVAAIGFSPNQSNGWELIRFCVAQNTAIAGAASKLIQHFIKTQNPRSIISYCDRSLFTGAMYQRAGFVWSHNLPPEYYYIQVAGYQRIYNCGNSVWTWQRAE